MNTHSNHASRGRFANIVAELRRIFLQNALSFLFVLVLTIEVGVGLLVIRDLLVSEAEVQKMYNGSVLGLREVGELQYQAQETRRSTLYALTTNDGNLQVRYADQSREADHRVSEGIETYLTQANINREAEAGKRLRDDWQAYLNVRDNVLGLILENSSKEAVELDLSSGVPLFERVRDDLEHVKRLYDQRASERLDVVTNSSRQSTIKLIGAFLLTLIFGSLAIWAIHRAQLRREMQLVKMQMEFVTSLSHELRTPIAAILLAGENVRDQVAREPKDLEEQGTIITAQANQLMELVDQVLTFSATAKSGLYYDAHPVSVQEIVRVALRNTESLLRKSGFEVEQAISSGLPDVVGDLAIYSLCLQNLIANAAKYSGQSRWIKLSAVVERSLENVLYVRIAVQDRGLGIDEADLSRIFEPFFRSPQVVAGPVHGSGLGLSIAKRNVELLGGRVSGVSTIGVGSTFSLDLPVYRVSAASYLAATNSALDH